MVEKTDIQKEVGEVMRSFLNKWAGIFITTLIILITGSTTAGVIALNNKERISRVQEDYLPYFAFKYIIESNNKLMSLYSAINLKDDQRYSQLMKEWNDLQQEVIKQAGLNKRNGAFDTIK